MLRYLLAAMTIAFFSVAPASAGACKTTGSVDAKEIVIDTKVADTLSGLHVSFQLGLEPPEFPASDITKITTPCSRGTVKVGASTVEVGGEDTGTPPRYVSTAGSIAYLASMPRPAAAWAWAKKYQADNTTPANFSGPNDTMYALVV